MLKKLMLVLGVLLVVGLAPAADTIAAPTDNPCKGKPPRPAECDDEETPGGQHNSLTVTLDKAVPTGTDNVLSDGIDNGEYSDSAKTVEAQLGGQTQPNKPGFAMSLKKVGKKSREVTVKLTCTDNGGLLPDNCGLLGGNPVEVTVDTGSLVLRPYEVACPDIGECPDVFTMGTGTANFEDMSFRINLWTENIFIEVASAIGSGGALNPGRCLSLLTTGEQTGFLAPCARYEVGSDNCDVSVVAYDNGDLAIPPAGVGDGENDQWRIDADDARALICNLNAGFVYGMTNLTFGVDAQKE